MSLGPVRDYFHTPINAPDNLTLAHAPLVRREAERDDLPLPPTEQREGYYDDRHFEYWLSGRRDAMHVAAAAHTLPASPIVLDLGGATGRVARHLPLMLGVRCFIGDLNEAHVIWTNTHLAPAITAFQTGRAPPLPLPDHSIDIAIGFSVFTHIYEYETAWLLELRRVLKPGALLYITVHDDETWNTIERSVFHPSLTSTKEYKRIKQEQPTLSTRVQFTYARDANVRICNVFHPRAYIEALWSNVFDVEAIHPLRHDHQAGVILRAPFGPKSEL